MQPFQLPQARSNSLLKKAASVFCMCARVHTCAPVHVQHHRQELTAKGGLTKLKIAPLTVCVLIALVPVLQSVL